MPIRFRCVYCNQLLGIAHRKAGTVVRCPTCAGQVVVPTTDTADAGPQDPSGSGEPFLFEQNDFDQIFTPAAPVAPPSRTANGASAAPHAVAEAPAGAWGTHAEPPFDAGRVAAPGGPGVVLSPTKATALCVAWVVTLALAFGAGLLIGMLMRPAASEGGHGAAKVITGVY